jgi:hypothetical protein
MESPALNDTQASARAKLVVLCHQMLAGELSFFEGAIQVCALRSALQVSDSDSDILSFIAIGSETDHLPPKHVQPHCSSSMLERLQPEFDKAELWANSFAVQACRNLIERFADHDAQPGVPADRLRRPLN